MPATITVLYKQGTKFDMDYYKKTHMPLVGEKWTPYGLKSWKVLQFGPEAPYTVQATLEWGDISEVQKASTSAAAKAIMDDVPNFSDTEAVLFAGEVVATS